MQRYNMDATLPTLHQMRTIYERRTPPPSLYFHLTWLYYLNIIRHNTLCHTFDNAVVGVPPEDPMLDFKTPLTRTVALVNNPPEYLYTSIYHVLSCIPVS